jgi:hypothetical protein
VAQVDPPTLRRCGTELFVELAARDVDRLLAGLDLALWDRPRPLVAFLPEGATGVDEQNLRPPGRAAPV